MTRRTTARRARAGFTLLELLIAMAAGLLTIMAAYYIGRLSAGSFHGQMRTSEMQSALRAAMEQLARDIPRAGFLSTADSHLLPDCDGKLGFERSSDGTPSGVVTTDGGRLYGARVEEMPADVKALLTADGNETRADVLTLLGNYETGDFYAVASDNLGDNQVMLESTREGFRRSFFTPVEGSLLGTFSLDRFKEAFAKDRLVRIDTNNRVFFRTVVDATADSSGANAIVTFTPALSPSCLSRATALITPVSMIRYRFENVVESDVRFKRLVSKTDYPGSKRMALVRSELKPETPTEGLPNSSRVVLDYAVEFQVDAVVDDNPSGVPNYRIAMGSGANSVYATEPRLFRALRVTLSTRAEELEMDWQAPAMRTNLTEPLLSFGVNAGSEVKHARVRTLRQEFLLPNL